MLARITAVVGELPPYMVIEGREAFKYYTSAGVLYERAKSVEADDTEPDGFNLVRYCLKLCKLNMLSLFDCADVAHMLLIAMCYGVWQHSAYLQPTIGKACAHRNILDVSIVCAVSA
jgi:hypothetical protein